jgi:cell wall-associated NlpC family hydrolase
MVNFKRLLLFVTVCVFLLGFSTITTYADENKTGTITASSLNLRSGPSTSDMIISSLTKGQSLTILKSSGSWYNVLGPDGISGWVNSTYVSTKNAVVSRGSITRGEQTKAATDIDSEIVSFAKDLLGVKYVWGGITPAGFDCSGFVKYVYDHFDINIDRVSTSQATQGVAVDKADLEPGDLVFFDTNGGHNRINHVGIYIGDGNFIQASSSRSAHKVVISSLTTGFYDDCYMRARRLF